MITFLTFYRIVLRISNLLNIFKLIMKREIREKMSSSLYLRLIFKVELHLIAHILLSLHYHY